MAKVSSRWPGNKSEAIPGPPKLLVRKSNIPFRLVGYNACTTHPQALFSQNNLKNETNGNEAFVQQSKMTEEGISISTGTACSSNHAGQPSYMLLAMGMDSVRARGSLRITLGRFTSDQEVNTFIEAFPRAVQNLSPIATRELATIS